MILTQKMENDNINNNIVQAHALQNETSLQLNVMFFLLIFHYSIYI